MYEFQGVTLDRKNGEYIVAVDGVVVETDLAPHQLRNPILAGNRFVTAVNTKMRNHIKNYMNTTGGNAVMGCKNNMPCTECRKYGMNLRSADCIFEDAIEDIVEVEINERIYAEST